MGILLTWVLKVREGRQNFLALGGSLLSILFLYGSLGSCAPIVPSAAPPANYKGPLAEGPRYQPEDSWIYERGDGRKVRFREGTFVANQLANLSFPLWVGKRWSYRGQSGRLVIAQEIDCEVVDFKQMTVTAGAFGAFECRCQCLIPGYDRNCGERSLWYAPAAKNIIKTKAPGTRELFELVEYNLAMEEALID